MALVPHLRPRNWRSRLAAGLGRKAAELVTVFVGVYAAFLLNDSQAHREERQRREQILSWMEERYPEMYAELGGYSEQMRRSGDDFNRRVEAGEMPPVRAFLWTTDYNSLELTGLLQSGGYTLLEIKTVRSLQDVDGTLREMVALALHDQQLSDALILPNLDKGPSAFYDPVTKRLRPTYTWYGDFAGQMIAKYAELRPQLERVLQQLKVERARNR